MADSFWYNQVRHVQDGQPVDAANTARPTKDLEGRDNYLRQRIDNAELGEGTVARDVALAPTVLVNQPVFWNRFTSRFEQALAGVQFDAPSGSLVPRPSAIVIGIVVYKSSTAAGDVLIGGRGRTTLANAVAATPAAVGQYYLSAQNPGMLVTQRPPVSVPVLFYDGAYAYLAPQLHSFLESHIHYRFELVCRPCGSDATVDGVVSIPSPDATLTGWLPADHTSFTGKVPTGASFGYNLATHPDLAAVFPPIPLGSAVMAWDKGVDYVGATLIPLGLNGLCYVNQDGIWWMSNCAGDVPWPSPFNVSSPPGAISANSSSGAECPRLEDMQLLISYTEMLFATDKTEVTSIQPVENSPLQVLDCNGRPATTGNVFLNLDLTFLEDPDTTTAGDLVFKALSGDTFRRGPVVEGLLQGSHVTLTSTRVTNVGTVDAPVNLYQGKVTVDVQTTPGDYELAPQVARLYDAKERYVDSLNVLYYAFPQSRASFIRFEFYVPTSGLPASPTFKMRALVYGAVSGTLPALTVTTKHLSRPSGSPLTLATPTENDDAFDSGVVVGAGQYVEVESAPQAVTAGATVLVTVSRAAGDGYLGEVGLIRIVGVIDGVSSSG